MIIRKILAAAAVGTLMAGQAHASDPLATLVRIDGTVMVNQGEQFRTATQGMQLVPGDRVMAMSGSDAVLVFAPDCEVPVAANSIVTIPEGSPCEGAAMTTQAASPMLAQAVGKPQREPGARNRMGWIIFGSAVGAAALYWGVIRKNRRSDPDPVSP
jgi:hypothetical protein